jgi:alkylation response protein AidB-like acyl-CoA dehydrogenase
MSEYIAPTQDLRFLLQDVIRLDEITALPGFEAATIELADQVLEEAGRLAAEVLAPLNHSGDTEGCAFDNGAVRTPEGFRDAYRQFAEGGWCGLSAPAKHGGMELPSLIGTAVNELWQSANMAFSLCPLLSQGAIHLLLKQGSEEQKKLYLPKLVSGEWTGTMNITEPQAGSDIGAARTRAIREDGFYRLKGQKIFITFGEHDLAENIVHLVLARTPGGPPGIKGLSLFLVPKFLPDENGSPGKRNDLHAVSIEHKLGIHASPTAVMAYGDNEGAIGTLIGEENQGIQGMFIMMNHARLAIGLQGVAIAERAYQQARAYACERVQGAAIGGKEPVTIIHHPDIRRMLLSMKARTEAMRALTLQAAAALDMAERQPDDGARKKAQALVDLLIPVVKGWCSETGVEIASLGMQIHGGMGYIEETGAAQHFRDSRIATIYEGTTGIQANDLIFRKLGRDRGEAARAYIEAMGREAAELAAADRADLAAIGTALGKEIASLGQASLWMLKTMAVSPDRAATGAVPYLHAFGIVAGGSLLGRAASAAAKRIDAGGEDAYLDAKIQTARFFVEYELPQARALTKAATSSGETILGLSEDQF